MSAWWRLFGPAYVPVGADGDVIVSVAGFPLGFVAHLTADEIGARSSDAVPAAATPCLGSARGRDRSHRTLRRPGVSCDHERSSSVWRSSATR